jgi:dihydropteroate synthase
MSLNSQSSSILKCGARSLDLASPAVMGVLNITPDSFSDGGNLYAGGHALVDKVLAVAEQMIADGAKILDIGGESTRPGATPVALDEELARVVPVVAAINKRFDVIVSVDTSSPEVMLQAADVGAGILNDVRGLSRPGALQAAAQTHLPVCVMHMKGDPTTMQKRPDYDNVVDEVLDYLNERINACVDAGIKRENIILDPGFGFGKTVEHNLLLLAHLERFSHHRLPLLVGMSRKSMLDKITGRGVHDRLAGSITLAALAAERGANIIRVHDVKETADALAVVLALKDVYS